MNGEQLYIHALRTARWAVLWFSIAAGGGTALTNMVLGLGASQAAASAICWGSFGAAVSLWARARALDEPNDGRGRTNMWSELRGL